MFQSEKYQPGGVMWCKCVYMQALPINDFQYTYSMILTAEISNLNKRLMWDTENGCGKFGVKSPKILRCEI